MSKIHFHPLLILICGKFGNSPNEGSSSPFKDQQECQTQILKTDTSPICFDAFNHDDDNDEADVHDDDDDEDDHNNDDNADDYDCNFFKSAIYIDLFFLIFLRSRREKQGMTKTENKDFCSDFKDKQKY